MKKHEAISAGVAVLCAAAGAALLSGLAHTPGWIAPLVCACLAALAGWRFWQNRDPRLKRIFGVLGFLLMLAASLSVRLHAAGATGVAALVKCALAALLLGPAAGQLCIWLKKGLQRLNRPVRLSGKRAFWLSFAVILLCWVPILLALFPGVTGYDMQSQVYQNLTGEYVNGHPIAHTLLIGLFYRLGEWLFANSSLGIGLYTIMQALCL